MILKNSKGCERQFQVLFKIEHQDNIYLVYQDKITKKIYAGLYDKDTLKKISSEEREFLNEIIKKVEEE